MIFCRIDHAPCPAICDMNADAQPVCGSYSLLLVLASLFSQFVWFW